MHLKKFIAVVKTMRCFNWWFIVTLWCFKNYILVGGVQLYRAKLCAVLTKPGKWSKPVIVGWPFTYLWAEFLIYCGQIGYICCCVWFKDSLPGPSCVCVCVCHWVLALGGLWSLSQTSPEDVFQLQPLHRASVSNQASLAVSCSPCGDITAPASTTARSGSYACLQRSYKWNNCHGVQTYLSVWT